jgi:hypothetical protein
MELAKTTSEQRSEIYDDVRTLLVPGFLSQAVSIGSARFVMRSIDQADWDLLQYRAWGLGEHDWRSWCVAMAIWMVNGSVVSNDEVATCRLFEAFVELPRDTLNMLYNLVTSLMRRVERAGDLLEGFLYEHESRSLWRTDGEGLRQRKATHAMQRFHNSVISLWIYYNQMEDRRESEDHDWVLTKFLVSPHAPKSVKKLNAQDKKRDADTRRRRERVQDRVYYEAKGLLSKKGEKDQTDNRPFQQVIMAETEEELRESMRRWVEGKKDDHDRVVDNAKAKIKYEVEKRKEDNVKRRGALDAALKEEGITRNQLVPLAGDAGKKFLERMQARFPGAKYVVDDHTHNSAYQKYIEKNPEVGDLHVDEEGNIKSLRPVTEDMVDVLRKPDQNARETLQDKISQRRPTATFVDDGEED